MLAMGNSGSSNGDTGPISANRKRIGGYLVEAGLLTPAQVDVALNDQKLTGMRFGEILAARGWVKQQTIEYLMTKVILPEQTPAQATNGKVMDHDLTSTNPQPGPTRNPAAQAPPQPLRQIVRREVPIAKPLPPVNSSDEDVSWVG